MDIRTLLRSTRVTSPRMAHYVTLLTLVPVLASCLSGYRGFPDVQPAPPDAKRSGTLSYQIQDTPFMDTGGRESLEDAFQSAAPFAKTKKRSEAPERGAYCLVQVEWRAPSLPAVVFGYISLSFLTLLPAWSTQEGYIIRYQVFVNGKEQEVFEYPVKRTVALWAGLLPLVWVNWLTPSQGEAFEATARQFFHDAAPIFSKVASR
ncbi:MAG: hypothetical protein ABIO65_03400 [Nitrospiria bacterium]